MMPQLLYYDTPDDIAAFSTTRHGGVSLGNYASMNVNLFCGDDVEAVNENRQRLCKTLHLSDPTRLVIPHQTHGTTVRVIDAGFLSLDMSQRCERLEGVDAVMTNLPQVCIGVSTADCTPIIIYDREYHAACAVHAGWRGTVARIASKAVLAMQEVYQSRPNQLEAWIGPCISAKNFEVGQEVYDQFEAAGFPMEHIATRIGKWHIDLPLSNEYLLSDVGLSHINQSAICTYDQVDDFFSARRMGILSGRIYTGLILIG